MSLVYTIRLEMVTPETHFFQKSLRILNFRFCKDSYLFRKTKKNNGKQQPKLLFTII